MSGSFAVWITGLPAAGKSALAAELARQLAARGVAVATLESDALRPIITPQPSYDAAERDAFYATVADLGRLLVARGVPVIFDATANCRRYRDQARREIPSLLEVYLDTPLAVCTARDPKGVYRQGLQGGAHAVPGLQAP